MVKRKSSTGNGYQGHRGETRHDRRFVAVSRMVGVGLVEKMDVSKDWKDMEVE